MLCLRVDDGSPAFFDHYHTYHHQTYKKAKSKYEKSAVVSAIVDSIESSSAEGGGFVRKDADKDRWYQVGDIIAREKVSYDVSYIPYLR